MQIKVFHEYFGEGNLDKEVNDWITTNKIDVFDIRHSTGMHDIHMVEFVTVTYFPRAD